jgi:ABC-2 type transport system ATP-binding protein
MADFVIEAQGLTRIFGAQRAVDGLDLRVKRGEVFGFLGPNGAGKTTTVRLLNGVLAPSAGVMRVASFDPVRQGSAVRRRTGVLTETPALYEQLTARQNLLIFGELYDIDARQLPARVDELLRLFDLADRANERAGTYSKGMKQRLALARALLHDPEVLFLDEPTAGLDPAAARQVTALIEGLSKKEGHTIFLCTHNLTEAQRLCDRVGVISRGRLLAEGTPAELADHLWHGNWVQITLTGSPSEALLAALRAVVGVIDIKVDGTALDMRVDTIERTPALLRAAVLAGAEIYSVTPRRRSLEEIYFELQANGGAAEAEP